MQVNKIYHRIEGLTFRFYYALKKNYQAKFWTNILRTYFDDFRSKMSDKIQAELASIRMKIV